jgi:integrase
MEACNRPGIYLSRGGSACAKPFPNTSTNYSHPAKYDEPDRLDNSLLGVFIWVNFMSIKKELKTLATRAGGSFKTVHDRQNVAGRLADQLKKMNIQIKAVSHLKSKHIESYISTRKEDGIGLRTLQNEMAGIRGILREAGRDTLADSERISNKSLQIHGASRDGTHKAMPDDRYQQLLKDLKEKDVGVWVCAQLERHLGLRAEESVQANKSIQMWAKQLESNQPLRVIYGTKGGRSRDVRPSDTEAAKKAVYEAINRFKDTKGRIIEKDNLKSAMNRHNSIMQSVGCKGIYSPHSLRYAFACDRIDKYFAEGYSKEDAYAQTSLDLGHGDGRGLYIKKVYSRR